MRIPWPLGGMADAGDLKSLAARRPGSNPGGATEVKLTAGVEMARPSPRMFALPRGAVAATRGDLTLVLSKAQSLPMGRGVLS